MLWDMTQRTDFSAMACSIARAWSVIGEPWTPLILRDLTIGLRRFDQLRQDLGISANILSDRLKTLEAAGIVERKAYKGQHRTRQEYHLTTSGEELVPVLIALTNWGDRWLSDNTPPAVFLHDPCGTDAATAVVVCSHCGDPMTQRNTTAHPGPGSRAQSGTRLIGYAMNNHRDPAG